MCGRYGGNAHYQTIQRPQASQDLLPARRVVGWGERRSSSLQIGLRGGRPLRDKEEICSWCAVLSKQVARRSKGFLYHVLFSCRGIPRPTHQGGSFHWPKVDCQFPHHPQGQQRLVPPPQQRGRVQCMQVWPPEGKKKFETLSYLPPLTEQQLLKQVEYLLRGMDSFHRIQQGFVTRENNRSPAYYDGRYWTMWKLPMFGCNDAALVVKELKECTKEYPNYFARIISYDNIRQVQCSSFIAYRPPNSGT